MINQDMADSLGVKEGDVVYGSFDMYNNLVAMIDIYNIEKDPSSFSLSKYEIQPSSYDTQISIPCRIAHLGNQSYGKFPKFIVEDQILMEYKHMMPLVVNNLPPGSYLAAYPDFKQFYLDHPEKINELSDFLMMTLPSPRISYYKSSDYFKIQRGITGHSNQII